MSSAVPLHVQITGLDAVPETEIARRLAELCRASDEERARSVVLVRDPQLTARDLVGLARRLRALTRPLGAQLWVADRLDVAALAGADGVHLGRRSVSVADARRLLGATTLVSVACHTVEEVAGARDAGADACTLSPIFPSPGKGSPLGTEALRAARALLGAAPDFALIALGGVDRHREGACLAAGADGVAAIRAPILGPGLAPGVAASPASPIVGAPEPGLVRRRGPG